MINLSMYLAVFRASVFFFLAGFRASFFSLAGSRARVLSGKYQLEIFPERLTSSGRLILTNYYVVSSD